MAANDHLSPGQFRVNDQVAHKSSGKTGTVISDEQDDPYGYGTRVVQFHWHGGRRAWLQAKNVRHHT
jgi:hypothetical protein